MQNSFLKSPAGPKGWLGLLRGFSGGAFLFGVLLATNVIQTLSLVLLPFSRHAFRRVNRACAHCWWGLCVLFAEACYGIRPIVTGDEVPERENAMVVANHQQMPDIIAIMMLAWQKYRLGDLKFFVKDALKYAPGIGWGMLFLDCLFVRRNWDADAGMIERTFRKFNRDHIPLWLVSFSEGTRWKPAKAKLAREFARAQGWPEPRHVLIPRPRGFVASVKGLRRHVTAVYDVTIGYEGGIPTLWQFLCGWSRGVHIHVRRFPIAVLPETDAELAAWLRERFREKDELMDVFLRTGSFPSVMTVATLLETDPETLPFVPSSLPGGVTPEA